MADVRDFFNGGVSLRALPTALRVLLTLFLVLIGGGYLMALGNLYCRFELADTRSGLTADDMRAHFHGVDVPVTRGSVGQRAGSLSRMLEKVQPGGSMYKHLTKGGEAAIRSLTDWLKNGATKDAFDAADSGAGAPAPSDVIARNCLRCHRADGGEKADTPYGPDLFTVDYALVYKFAAPGTAKGDGGVAPASQTAGQPSIPDAPAAAAAPLAAPPATEHLPAQSYSQLFLVAHIHMLAMPVFALIVGGLFLLTDWPRGLKGTLAVLPMLAMLVDFSSWWLSRSIESFVYVVGAAGAAFGVGLAIQLLSVLYALWFGCRRDGVAASLTSTS